MKDTVTYPLSAIMDEDEESPAEQLERKLAEAIAKERERCALVVERVSIPYENTSSEAAAAIRKGE